MYSFQLGEPVSFQVGEPVSFQAEEPVRSQVEEHVWPTDLDIEAPSQRLKKVKIGLVVLKSLDANVKGVQIYKTLILLVYAIHKHRSVLTPCTFFLAFDCFVTNTNKHLKYLSLNLKIY